MDGGDEISFCNGGPFGGTTNLLVAAGNADNVLISAAGLTNLTITNYVGTNLVITNSTFDTSAWSGPISRISNTLQGVEAGSNGGQNGALYTIENGTDWVKRSSRTTSWLNDVTYVGDTWFVVRTQGLLLSRCNLVTWTKLDLPSIKSPYGATSYGGQLVVSGIEGVILRN